MDCTLQQTLRFNMTHSKIKLPCGLYILGKLNFLLTSFFLCHLQIGLLTEGTVSITTSFSGLCAGKDLGTGLMLIANTPLSATILDLKRGWTGIKIAKMANDHCCLSLCNNDRRYDGGKDLPYFSFPMISRNESACHL